MQGPVLVKSSGHCFELAHLVSAFQNVRPMVNRNVLAFSKNGWAWPNATMELLSRIVRKYGTVRHNWQRRVRILMYQPASRGIRPGMPPASQSTRLRRTDHLTSVPEQAHRRARRRASSVGSESSGPEVHDALIYSRDAENLDTQS
jgi:hypothetical protein